MKALLCLLFAVSTPAFSYDCNTDCGDVAAFRYPCPKWDDLGRQCDGREPSLFATCTTAKAASCDMWQRVVAFTGPKIRPFLEPTYNHSSWAAAQANGSGDGYMAGCIAAGGATCAALGAQITGPMGVAVTGALGSFVSYQVCKQSQVW